MMLNLANFNNNVFSPTLLNLTTMRASADLSSTLMITPFPKRECSIVIPVLNSAAEWIPFIDEESDRCELLAVDFFVKFSVLLFLNDDCAGDEYVRDVNDER